eukprot:CAMPEP_0119467584 /NCGR_PEP_ID=MMETSP1344-20130328/1706_1 /TAXON_ID=236787 /ORGANISM="Florenciella parvula, Strain CCMP2471" /LENGTH=83 /DNA_ID=CAMNT_0007499963 /DNA_START=124 /DNA_END=373 /DNA_ORIENTATION=+
MPRPPHNCMSLFPHNRSTASDRLVRVVEVAATVTVSDGGRYKCQDFTTTIIITITITAAAAAAAMTATIATTAAVTTITTTIT